MELYGRANLNMVLPVQLLRCGIFVEFPNAVPPKVGFGSLKF